MTPERIEQEREKFEAWANQSWRHTEKDNSGEYLHSETAMMFSAWLARSEQENS